jgi:phage tail protein X
MVAKIGQKCYHYYLKVKSAVEVVLPVKQGLKQDGVKLLLEHGALLKWYFQ